MIFPNVLGQPRAAAQLQGFLSTQRIPSAILFHGMEGIGKTMMAVEFAKALHDCQGAEGQHPDLIRVNAQYQACLREEEPAKQKSLKVDTIRHLKHDMELRSLLGGWKVAIVEEAHTLEIEAANALLKILEEPNPGVLWILVTSQRERLPKTIISRCFSVSFAPLAAAVVAELLTKNGVERAEADALAAYSEGSVSRALTLSAAGYPETLTGGPMAAITAVEGLAKELFQARTQVELAIYALAQKLRLKHLSGALPFDRVERPLQELDALRHALRCNADPKSVLTLACAEAERAGL